MSGYTQPTVPRVLYIVYWGAAEPLGQSLVLPAVKRLARLGTDLTLVTFEKPEHWRDRAKIASIRDELATDGVRWVPLPYHKRPKVPATAYDILTGVARSCASRLHGRYDLIHARTYIGGLIGMALAPLLRTRWIFHNEGFYPDEQVDGGVWRAGSRVHRFAQSLEQKMYARADGIIALSHRAQHFIEELPCVQSRKTPVLVVPSCVDLEHFHCSADNPEPPQRGLSLVYIGSIGQRYLFNRVAQFAAAARKELGEVRLRVLTGTDAETVSSMLRAEGLPERTWSVGCVPHSQMPAELTAQHAGLFFLTRGISEHGCSPTKIGEYWAMGLPVVTTPNVSDTDEIIRQRRVGVIVREHSEQEYRRAARELADLRNDPALAERCRAAAAQHYGLARACEQQRMLYEELRTGWGRHSCLPERTGGNACSTGF